MKKSLSTNESLLIPICAILLSTAGCTSKETGQSSQNTGKVERVPRQVQTAKTTSPFSDWSDAEREGCQTAIAAISKRLNQEEVAVLTNALASTNRQTYEEGLRVLLSAATTDELRRLGVFGSTNFWTVAWTFDTEERGRLFSELLDANDVPALEINRHGYGQWQVRSSQFIKAQRLLLTLRTNKEVWVWTLPCGTDKGTAR